jgi:hypothetical protein
MAMNGFISKALRVAYLGGGLALAGGCVTYHDLVDPCWPDRYNCAARREVEAAFGPQVFNGHVLDQTIWNCMFEPGTDCLTPCGTAHLVYIAERRPHPDPKVYVQTAFDVPYDPCAPELFAQARNSLDQRRVVAIQKYLTAITDGHPIPFEVVVHDPPCVGLSAIPVNIAIQQMYTGFRGNLPITAGVSVTGGGGVGAVR